MVARPTSAESRLKAAPEYISQAAASTDVGGCGRSGAGAYRDIASPSAGCGHGAAGGAGGAGVADGHDAGRAGAVCGQVTGWERAAAGSVGSPEAPEAPEAPGAPGAAGAGSPNVGGPAGRGAAMLAVAIA